MKILTVDEKCEKIAKDLIKKFKTKDVDKKVRILGISSSLDYIQTKVDEKWEYHMGYEFDNGTKVTFGKINFDSKAFGDITSKIHFYVKEHLKTPKKYTVIDNKANHTEFHGWSSYDYTLYKSIMLIEVCKEFTEINKKLMKIGCNPISIKGWCNESVFGKRSHYDVTSRYYYATSSKTCQKILDYLKGKKKVSYELVTSENLEDRDYGERYETEWSGSINHYLRFKDSKGVPQVFYS